MKHPCRSDKPKPETQLNRYEFQFCMYIPLNNYILNVLTGEPGLCFFVFCCISACLPKTEGSDSNWSIIIDDLIQLNNSIISSDAILYSGFPVRNEACLEVVMWCYLVELEAIVGESIILQKNVNKGKMKLRVNCASIKNNIVFGNCTTCEQFEEKNYADFIEDFLDFLRELNVRNIPGVCYNDEQ